MTIRVLHIFAPNYKKRFGGPIFDWKYAFSSWTDPEIQHFVLDYDSASIEACPEAFSFKMDSSESIASRFERGSWVFLLLKNLIQHKNSYDILHFHLLWWGGLLAATWAKYHGIPTVYQSVLLNSDTPGSILRQRLGKVKARLLKNFSKILPISDALSQDYYDHDYSRSQVITLMNSVNTDMFLPVESNVAKENLREKFDLPKYKFILLFTGSIIRRKGVDILVKGFIEASKLVPDLHLLIIGPQSKKENPSIDETYVEDLITMIKSVGLDSKTTFTGLIKDRKEVAQLYKTADLFVFPSRNEGLPNVVLEAMACGLPVIVSDLPGLRSVVKNKHNGYIIPIGDAEALIEAIIQMKQNPVFSSKLGDQAHNYVFAQHRFEMWQSDLVRIYKDMMI